MEMLILRDIIAQPDTADNPMVGWGKTYRDKIEGLSGPDL